MRDEAKLNETVRAIVDEDGRLDGLIAAAGINEEHTALEYTAADFNKMMEINVTGAFLTAQAAARQMVRLGKGGSIVMIASMSGTIANRVNPISSSVPINMLSNGGLGLDLSRVQRVQVCGPPARP